MNTNMIYPEGFGISNQSGPIAFAMRSYLSTHHYWSAKHFIGLARRMEDEHQGRPIFNIEHRGYVLGAILCGAGFFDAAINEVYQDANDCHGGYVDPLGWVAICKLGRKWRETEGASKRMRIMEKYQEVLVCTGRDKFDAGRAPYQNAQLAVSL